MIGAEVASVLLPRLRGKIIKEIGDDYYLIEIDGYHRIFGHKDYWRIVCT